MKQINEIMPTPTQIAAQDIQAVKIQVSPDQAQAVGNEINRMFNQLKAIYTSWRWTWNTPEAMESAKAVWLSQLLKNGVTSREQIDQGLNVALSKNQKYLPHVNDFVGWCLNSPVSGDVPTLAQVYEELLNGAQKPLLFDWSHKISYWCGFGMWSFLKETTHEKPSEAIKVRYEKMVKRFYDGNLPEIPKAGLEDKTGIAVTPEEKSQNKKVGNQSLKAMIGNLK